MSSPELTVTKWRLASGGKRYYQCDEHTYYVQPAKIVRTPGVIRRDPDMAREYYEDQLRQVKAWKNWKARYTAMPWYKKLWAKRPDVPMHREWLPEEQEYLEWSVDYYS